MEVKCSMIDILWSTLTLGSSSLLGNISKVVKSKARSVVAYRYFMADMDVIMN